MNRTDRLYALVEELRFRAPQPTRATVLSQRFEVSTRTIERDLLALQEAGVPIWARPGPHGGYGIDAEFSLPPLNLTAEEAVAVATALATAPAMPFSSAGKSALAKLSAVMRSSSKREAAQLSTLVRLEHYPSVPDERVTDMITQSLLDPVAMLLRYCDRDGVETDRVVEPVGILGSKAGWYLVAWCRLRRAPRTFKFDRIRSIELTAERIAPRSLDEMLSELPFGLDQPAFS